MYVAPIAVTLCFGLAFATALVLLVIPAMVLLLESAKYAAGDTWVKFSSKTGIESSSSPAVRESAL